jgi:kynurenine formamidase
MRPNLASRSIIALAVVLASWTGQNEHALAQTARGGPPPVNDTRTTKEQFDRWMTEFSNWGRWGKGDELGAVNLITSAKRQQAALLAKAGLSVSLAHPLITEKAVDAANPYKLSVTANDVPDGLRHYALETQTVSFHGITFSHFDALCHVSHEGKIYNGFAFQEVVSNEGGCAKEGVAGLKDGIVTRGVLVDIPRLKGLPYLEPGTHVYREDIEAWEKQAGVKVAPGDAMFLRTGRWMRRAKVGPFLPLAGFDPSFLPFLKDRDVALLGSDTTQDVGTLPGVLIPIHKFAMVARGMNILDNMDLEALAETAARLKRWDFMLVVAPTPVIHGSGSAINPIAIF